MIKISFNTSDFENKIMLATKKVEQASKEGMSLAVRKFMLDALHKSPSCPIKSGAMAASHSVFVDGNLIAISNYPVTGKGEATPFRSPIPKISQDIEGTLIVNKPYAAAQHEGVGKGVTFKKYTAAGSGKKWVESKLFLFGSKYFDLIARRIKSS